MTYQCARGSYVAARWRQAETPARPRGAQLPIPKLGITIPNMGIQEQAPVSLADALFTKVQQRVLGVLFGQPDRSFLSKEVIAAASSGTGAVHRELRRLAASGIVTVRSAGWGKALSGERAVTSLRGVA
jgi:hypothetical protein